MTERPRIISALPFSHMGVRYEYSFILADFMFWHEELERLREWAAVSLRGRCVVQGSVVLFEFADDALLFKLTWG